MEPRGVFWPTGMQNQSSCPWPEPRKSWSLHPVPHYLPQHLLWQASTDGPKPSTGYRRQRKRRFLQSPPLPPVPVSPLAPLGRLGTSKPLCPGRLMLTDTAGTAKLMPEARTASKCLRVPSQRHQWSPRAGWEVTLPGTEIPRADTPTWLPRLFQCWRRGRAPLLEGCPKGPA